MRLDPATKSVTREGVEVELTRREFAVLELLFRADGAPVSSDKILTHVWGLDADIASNVVQVNIGYLRKKIDAPFGTSVLETVRGVGYLVVSDSAASA